MPEKQEACVRCAPHLVQSGVKAILPPTRPTFVQRHDCWLHKESVSSLSNCPCQDTSAARRRAACPSATSTSGLRNRPSRSRAMAILPTPGDSHSHFPGQRGECIHSNRLPPDKMERGTDRPTLLPPSHIRVPCPLKNCTFAPVPPPAARHSRGECIHRAPNPREVLQRGRGDYLNCLILLISASESLSAGAAGRATVQVNCPYMLCSPDTVTVEQADGSGAEGSLTATSSSSCEHDDD